MRKRVDYGSLILLLVILIVGIFGVDSIRRKVAKMRGDKTPLVVNSIRQGNDQPRDPLEATYHDPSTTEPYVPYDPNAALQSSPNGDNGSPVTSDTAAQQTPSDGSQSIALAADDVHKGSLILVDATHALASQVESTPFLNIKYDHFRLPSKNLTIANETVDSVVTMFNDFFKESALGNVMIYATMNVPTAAQYSVVIPERATGLSLDLAVWDESKSSHAPFQGDGNYAWLAEHAADYGYVQRFPAGKEDKTSQAELKWHYRYVGVPHAAYMKQEGLCLEEYLEKIKSYPANGEHLKISAGGVDYEVFYAAANGASTEVSIPAGCAYTVSGDNLGGFIIATHAGASDAGTAAPATTTAPIT